MTYPTSELSGLLAGAGVPAEYAAPAAAYLGPRAADRLRADPWELLLVPGVRPEQADHFARQVLGAAAGPDDPRRGRALVTHLLAAAARQGHTALPARTVAERLVALRVADPVRAIMDSLDEALIVGLEAEPDEAAEGGEGGEGGDPDQEPTSQEVLALARYAMAEEAAAEGFMRLAATAEPDPDAPVGHGLSLFSGPAAEDAALAVAALAAGRGSRTVVAAITERRAAELAAQAEQTAEAEQTAQAGQAAGAAFTSIQRLLGAVETPGGIAFTSGEQSPLEVDLIVVPDATTLDVELAAALVEACADGTRLILAGDPAMLPSTGPGQVFADLIAARTVPLVRTQSAGPDSEGPIERLLGTVREGELARIDAPGREVVIVPAGGPAEAVHRAVQLVADSIPGTLGIPAADVQVVAPAQRGEAGTTALNAALKARLNPGPGACGGFDPGDRVLAVAPLPGAPAGETGVVRAIGERGLHIDFPGGPVTVAGPLLTRLRPGWAITIQQSAGTRWPAVVAVFTAESLPLLSRPLVATAIGRAARHLSVVHAAGPELARAVADIGGSPRRTRLAGLLSGM